LSVSFYLKVWLLCCTFFVFLALMEYFIVLFGIRYDSHWRRSQLVSHAVSAFKPPPEPSPARISLSNQNLQVPHSSISNLPNVETPVMNFERTATDEVVECHWIL
jgi:hypothetical protein